MSKAPQPSSTAFKFRFVLLILALLAAWGQYSLLPKLLGGTLTVHPQGFEQRVTTFPIEAYKNGNNRFGPYEFSAEFVMAVSSWHSKQLLLRVDDCLLGLRVNGKDYTKIKYPSCRWNKWRRLDLSSVLLDGRNTFEIRAKNQRGAAAVELKSDRAQFSILALRLVCIVSFGVFVWLLIFERSPLKNSSAFATIVTTGVVLRLLYYWTMPYFEKAHDVAGHILYIDAVRSGEILPKGGSCFECHQPPIYYYAVVVWNSLLEYVGFQDSGYGASATLLSLIFSFISFSLMIAIGRQLFKAGHEKSFLIYLGLVAVNPSFIFQVTRVSNDVGALLIQLSVLFLFMLWLKKPTLKRWTLVAILAAFSPLVKGSNFVILGIVGLCALLHRMLPMKRRIKYCFLLSLFFGLLCGGYYYQRQMEEKGDFFGPINKLNPRLTVSNHLSDYLTFNPVEILRTTYNNPFKDDARREHFWEWSYRSIFLGEFNWGDNLKWCAQLMLYSGLLLIPLLIFGLAADLRAPKEFTWLLVLLCFVYLSGSVAFRFKYPISVAPTFRLIMVVVVGYAYFIARGSEIAEKKIPNLGALVIAQHIAACTAFFVLLYFRGL